MQIHELNNFNGNADSAYLAMDDGTDTGKISGSDFLSEVKQDIDDLDDTLNARIDNIIAGGAAPSEAEVTDARLGAAVLGSVVYPSLGDSIRGQITELNSENRKMTLHISKNKIDPSKIEEDTYYSTSGGKATGDSTMRCTGRIPVSEGDVLRYYDLTTPSNMYFVTAYSGNTAYTASGATSVNTYTVPAGIDNVIISLKKFSSAHPMLTINDVTTDYEEFFKPYYTASDDFLEGYVEAESENRLSISDIVEGKYINANGNENTDATMCRSGYIAVKPGDVIAGSYGQESSVMPLRYVAAYTANKVIVQPSGSNTEVNSFTVPDGIYFVVVSCRKIYMAPSKYPTITLNGEVIKYQYPYSGDVPSFVQKNYTDISNLYNYPLTSLPEYVLNSLAYRPLGPLSKGYICLISDDGNHELATYTLPMVISKGVPLTCAVMSTSEVFTDSDETDTVVDAVENHGCCIAQHGSSRFTEYDEFKLNRYFDSEKDFFDSLGLDIYGAVEPGLNITNLVRAITGGRFGCSRTGYQLAEQYYGSYCNGPRSNMFGLSTQALSDDSLESQMLILDQCKTNHWLRCLSWHDNALDAGLKSKLEALIDYGLSIGLEFITMADIPTIV